MNFDFYCNIQFSTVYNNNVTETENYVLLTLSEIVPEVFHSINRDA